MRTYMDAIWKKICMFWVTKGQEQGLPKVGQLLKYFQFYLLSRSLVALH